jgi:plasmid stability protein
MGQVIVRNLDDHIITALKTKAEMRGHSLEQELRGILAEAAKPTIEDRRTLIDHIRAMTPSTPQTDSTILLREDRDR